jgi:hypothetical protein
MIYCLEILTLDIFTRSLRLNLPYTIYHSSAYSGPPRVLRTSPRTVPAVPRVHPFLTEAQLSDTTAARCSRCRDPISYFDWRELQQMVLETTPAPLHAGLVLVHPLRAASHLQSRRPITETAACVTNGPVTNELESSSPAPPSVGLLFPFFLILSMVLPALLDRQVTSSLLVL